CVSKVERFVANAATCLAFAELAAADPSRGNECQRFRLTWSPGAQAADLRLDEQDARRPSQAGSLTSERTRHRAQRARGAHSRGISLPPQSVEHSSRTICRSL